MEFRRHEAGGLWSRPGTVFCDVLGHVVPPIHPGDTVAADHFVHIIDGLRNRTLPKAEWTHGAHLTAAIALLEEAGVDGAIAAMPEMIQRYNEATGVNNTDTEGYHHTITVFYLHVIDDFCRETPTLPPHEQATAFAGVATGCARLCASVLFQRVAVFGQRPAKLCCTRHQAVSRHA